MAAIILFINIIGLLLSMKAIKNTVLAEAWEATREMTILAFILIITSIYLCLTYQ